MNYKKTLNLPSTEFPMKANLKTLEPKIIEKWDKTKLYDRIIDNNMGKKKFILHDGPPYANGNIHIGTSMNKILKDIVIRSRRMFGYDANYIPGWDCHGLPIEHNVDKQLGQKKRGMDKLEVRKYCRRYAENFIDIQCNEFKRLGILADWDNPYLTMNYEYQATIAKECYRFAKNNTLYRKNKPIHWCCNCKTALAEAEIEYADQESTSIYVKFPIIDFKKRNFNLENKNLSLLIWTTTPWTLPANLAVTLHPDFIYCIVETINGDVFIIAEDLLERCMSKIKISKYKILNKIFSKELEYSICSNPIDGSNSLIILGEHVTLDVGTGCVHTAPGHGREDYEVGNKYGLNPYCPVDENGFFVKSVEFFGRMSIFKSNKHIINKLLEKNMLIYKENIIHSYPHCWRCNRPIIFRATPQWFISMDKTRLREKSLKAILKVKWEPKWAYNRIYNMIKDRPDWCVSRQRTWGVPIVVIYCKKCNNLLINDVLMEKIFLLFKKYSSDIWFSKKINELINQDSTCEKCGSKEFIKEEDILDVWFDSGVSHLVVLKNNLNLKWPADLYLEGSDQHRGWFQSSLMTSVNALKDAPYKSVLTHGFVVDSYGKKMSKSIGNVISPEKIIKKYGSEIVRLWVASSNYKDDIRISDDMIKQLSDSYRKIRNISRFLLGNLNDFIPSKHTVNYTKMTELDRFALHQLEIMLQKVLNSYEEYDFHVVYHTIYDYCISDLSSFYLDILKDRLYTSSFKSIERRSAQTVMYKILDTIIKVLAPILVFTSEEIWKFHIKNKDDSIHLHEFPKPDKKLIDWELNKRWDIILELRSEVTKALEESRKNGIIGHSLDASIKIIIANNDKIFQNIKKYKNELRSIFIVSNVEVTNKLADYTYLSKIFNEIMIDIKHSSYDKCARCWIHDKSVGGSTLNPTICDRCISVLNKH